MHVRRIALQDFRSWARVDLELGPGRTVFVGPNGHGKTNLIEAVWYSAVLSSHRVGTDAPLIRAGAERAVVSTIVVNEEREIGMDLEIVAGRANKARLNRSPLRAARDVLGVLRAVLFAPEDLALVRGDPGERRRFLDELAAARRPIVAGVRAEYERVVKQRTALLKTAAAQRGRVDAGLLASLEVWDGQLAEQGARLLAARLDLVGQLRPEVEKAYQLLAPGSRPADLVYRCSAEQDIAVTDVATLQTLLTDALTRRRKAELERGVCLVGPHRDELELRLGDQLVRGFASHGESWSMALALRLAAYELLRAEGGDPVLLLDDVFAELDSARRRALAAVAERAEQVLLTTAVAEDIPGDWQARRLAVTMDDGEHGPRSVIAT